MSGEQDGHEIGAFLPIHRSENACLTRLIFSTDVLGRPLLTASKTDPVSINFLCH